MALEILTRMDEVRRNVLGYSGSNVVRSGTWVARDANGNAITPTADSLSAQLVILGNENDRPDSLGSESVTVQYGSNRFAVGAEGYVGSFSPGDQLAVGTAASGDVGGRLKAPAAPNVGVVAIVEEFKDGRLVFRTLA